MSSDALLNALMPAYSDNPAARHLRHFARFTENCAKPSRDEYLSLLHACTEGPVVSKRQSHNMLLLVFKVIAKYEMQKEHKDILGHHRTRP